MPITPVWSLRANIILSRLLGADDIWLGDHAKSMFPRAAWGPELSTMARFMPSLDAYLDPTVAIAQSVGRFGPRMGTAVTDPLRRTSADLARVWMSLHHLSRGRVVLGIGAGERENTDPIGLVLDAPVDRLEDVVVAIRAAWDSAGKPLTHAGKFHHWKDAIFALPKRRGTTPPIWIAAQGPRACRVAGQHGGGWIYMVTSGFDGWLSSAKQVVAGAAAAGRNPESLVRSVIVNPLLVRDQGSAEEMARQPMVQVAAMMSPGRVWAAAGASHPLGVDFAGVSELDPAELQSGRLAAHGKAITADLIRKLFLFGTAEEVVAALRPYVNHGVDHFIIYSYAFALKPAVAARYLVEQRGLIRLLKGLTAGSFATNS
jgi:phthiodiolone/phenolphthiodiolone dimycocerosates ketoreductase